MLTFGSLFSGIGGFDLGLERAGMQCVWQVEIDPFCQRVLEKHWPNVERFSDVMECGKHNLKSVDVICGGFPCQPHSLSGKRKASSDDRDLWPEFSRIISEIRPKWVMAENVPGLLSSENGRFFGRILADLAASGYCAEWQSIPAAAFGAPHIRERVYVLAHATSGRERGLSIRSREPQQATCNIVGSGEIISNTDCHKYQSDSHARRRQGTDELFTNPEYYPFLEYQLNHNQITHIAGYDQWATEPDVGRVAHGIPARMDRLKGLGNAVVPQVVQWLGERILQAECALTIASNGQGEDISDD